MTTLVPCYKLTSSMQHYKYDGMLTMQDYQTLLTLYTTEKTLQSNRNVVEVNPDYYSLWNDRRKMICLLSDFDYTQELKWLIKVISIQPKSYWTWNHRLWCLSNIDLTQAWKEEMVLIQHYLTKDPRNFHVWDYRKRILTKHYGDFWTNDLVLIKEIEFVMIKIKENFSNYSAWHWKSKMIEALFKINCSVVAHITSDMTILLNCFYSDPNDQSGWFYFNWLIDFMTLNKITIDRKSVV